MGADEDREFLRAERGWLSNRMPPYKLSMAVLRKHGIWRDTVLSASGSIGIVASCRRITARWTIFTTAMDARQVIRSQRDAFRNGRASRAETAGRGSGSSQGAQDVPASCRAQI